MATSERELVDRARAGDGEAYAELVRRHAPRVRRLTYHLLHGHADADDIAQETFVRAHQALARFDARSEFFTWLYRIAVNLTLNRARALGVRRHVGIDTPEVEASLLDPRGSDLEAGLEQRRLASALLAELDELPDSLRTTLIMVCIEDMPQDQVAAILGCSSGTVAWRVHEARHRLREALAARGLESLLDQVANKGARARRTRSGGDA